MQKVDKLVNKVFKVCPPHFKYVPSVNGCYKVLLKNYDWYDAAAGCRELHRDAHLVVIDNVAEQRAIVSMMTHYHNEFTLRPCGSGRWSLMWTAGQRVDTTQNTPFVWKVISADYRSTTVTHMSYTHFLPGQPDYGANVESCLGLQHRQGYQWNDAECSTKSCSICEIDLN